MKPKTYFCRITGSTPTVGSSSIITLGLCNKLMASDTLLLWPPLIKFKKREITLNLKSDKTYITF